MGKNKGGLRLTFNAAKRRSFVTGFKKRKDERRAKAKEAEKEEKKEVRKELE